MSYVKRGLIPLIAEKLGISHMTVRRRVRDKRESLANLYSPTVCALAYAHEQGFDLSHMMSDDDLRQVKEIMGSGLKLVISDRKSQRFKQEATKLIPQGEPASLKALLETIKKENKNELAVTLFDQLIDHPRIKRVSRPHWNNKQYRSAVLDAQIELENMVKEKADYPKDNRDRELSGTSLMHKVFDVNNPLLKWSNLDTQVLRDELEGYRFLFVGSVMGVRNPKAHLVFRQTPWRALQLLVFTTLLAELLDRCEYCGPHV